MTGAEIVVRCLQEEGVEYVFGYPGGAVLFIYDELFKQDKVKHVLVRHEQGAVHAADGYARSTDKVGVALVTSGPGVTNAVTGIATAYMDSIPMVIITGQVPTHAIGQDAFQECDTVGITRPCVKHNFLVKDVKDLASTMKKAFYIAATGRPGPGAWSTSRRTSRTQTAEFDYPEDGRDALVQPGDARATRARSRRRCSCCSRRSGRWSTPAAASILGDAAPQLTRLVRLLGLPVHQHADGPRRLSRRPTRSSSACSACTARTKRTWRCSTATCCSRSARASTTA